MTYFSKMSQFVSALSEGESQSLAEISLIEMEVYARREADIWKAALERIGFRDWGWNFASKVKGELDANKDSLGQIDLFIKTERNWSAEELRELQDFAIKEVNYRIVGDTPMGLWSFPWIVPLKVETFPSLKAQNLVLSTCEMPTLDDLLALKAYADKVILVKDCEPNPKPLIYSGLLHRGLQFFSLDNKDTQFIQINLEALQFLVQRDLGLRSKKLVLVSQTSDRKNKLALIAGWSSVPWNPKYRAYEVNATIDLVEWFKLPENIWPDLE
jgi:hypothetical protein